ncbi:hypothetical protein BKA56DRAFT_733974 [Ilyonectria sp. MPI-CAGE-AT-0026]|nr:hypothetical protein BKA56DRAFT_733974 [Ilyonectria sp. MPI-CAGE-AT-0026]
MTFSALLASGIKTHAQQVTITPVASAVASPSAAEPKPNAAEKVADAAIAAAADATPIATPSPSGPGPEPEPNAAEKTANAAIAAAADATAIATPSPSGPGPGPGPEPNAAEKTANATIAAAADATAATATTPTVIPATPGFADSEPPLYGAEKAADAAIAAAAAADAAAAAVATPLAIPAAEHAHLAAMGFAIPDHLLAPPPAPPVDPMVEQARALIVPEMEELSKEEYGAQRTAQGFDNNPVQTRFQERKMWYKAAQESHNGTRREYVALLKATVGIGAPYKWSDHHKWLAQEIETADKMHQLPNWRLERLSSVGDQLIAIFSNEV